MNQLIRIATLAFVVMATCPLASNAFAFQGEPLQPYASPTAPQQRYMLGFTGVDLPGAGVQIRSVVPGGPMTRMTMAGSPTIMKADPGDIIVAINGFATPTMASVAAQLARTAPQGGHCRVTLRNINNGMNQDFNAVATPQPIAPPPVLQRSYSLGIAAQESPGQGIIVSSTTPGGPATQLVDPSNPGVRNIYLDPGDIITSINGMPTLSGAQYQAAMQALNATAGHARLTLLDVRTGQLRTLNAIATLNQTPAPNPNPVPNPNPNPWPAPNPNPGQNFDPNAPRKVHVVIAGQSGTSNEGFNNCIRTSLGDLDQMLTRIGSQFLGSKTVLRDGNCTADQIRNTLNSLRPAPQDTVFFYYTGHGAQNAAGHFLQTSATAGSDLPRQEIAQILQRHNARLSVFHFRSLQRGRRTKIRIEGTNTDNDFKRSHGA